MSTGLVLHSHASVGSLFRSDGLASVKMMQAADLWNLDHVTEQGRLDRSAERCIFFERQMRTATFVVIEIILEYSAQPSLMEDNDVVQAFAPNGTDETLNVGILPRALGVGTQSLGRRRNLQRPNPSHGS